ncbi:MAG: Re/Si-specific NAD(P)(+) transhydrogenase subunit alpha [Candidatus Hydrogenedentota bacterium]|nr:MAG: Re/Si-specific NAD(P)(+) transhydrogenase subunit alpha [Candidatus Hydrogenedentota bacterium]
MLIAVPREKGEGERRVALIPETVARFVKAGNSVLVEAGAGAAAGFPDEEYTKRGAEIAENPSEVWSRADVLLKVNPPTAEEAGFLKEGAALIAFLWPHLNKEILEILAKRDVLSFAMDKIPRITRAQTMDALSSMSSLAGYKAAVVAADRLSKQFPMMMTAAGTIAPAKVFVLGAGVAGLQAIATAHRLGAHVEAYDIRPAVKEQVESLGAKFVVLELETEEAEDKGGYAKAQDEAFYEKQRQMMLHHVAAADAVITTALVPGRKAPILVTEEMVKGMRAGSVVVDLAAEQGGNCELTEPGKEVVKHNVLIVGMVNVPSSLAYNASQMYSRNIAAFLNHLLADGKIDVNREDEITKATLVTAEGRILQE